MYHKIGIHRLSPSQISKILNGHAIRVKHGSGHEIHVSHEQHKKIMSAHKKGKAHTMRFDPYQIAQHQHLRHGTHAHRSHGESSHMSRGEGIHSHHASHGEGYMDYLAPVARAVAPIAIDYGANALKNYASGHGEGIKRRGRPRKHVSMGEGRAGRRRGRGEGIHSHHASHGEGWAGDLLKAGARAVAPIAIDYGANALKNYASGHGEGIRRRGRKSRGEALYPAGYGEGEGGYGIKRRGRKSRGEGMLDFSILDKRKQWDDYVKSHKGKGAIGSVLGSLAGGFLPF